MHAAPSIATQEKKLTSPPSRRSFAKRSPSTVPASRNLRRKRSLKPPCTTLATRSHCRTALQNVGAAATLLDVELPAPLGDKIKEAARTVERVEIADYSVTF